MKSRIIDPKPSQITNQLLTEGDFLMSLVKKENSKAGQCFKKTADISLRIGISLKPKRFNLTRRIF